MAEVVGTGGQWGRLWSLFGALESQDGSKWACYIPLLSQERDEAVKTKWRLLGPDFVSFVISSHWIILLPSIHSLLPTASTLQ